jgi:hypothetical protein
MSFKFSKSSNLKNREPQIILALIQAAIALTLVLFATASRAETVDVKGVEGQNDGTTTIEIRKARHGENAKRGDALWEVQDGTADIEGETAAMVKAAKSEWSKACKEWKSEFRADNKENKIISMSCGTANCGGETGSLTCTSKAVYKIKTKIN